VRNVGIEKRMGEFEMRRLEGKIAIITGGAGGLGSATAERYASEGATVIVADIREEAAHATAAKLGNGSIGMHFDCGDPASVEAGIEETVRRFGKLDVIFNNAAETDYDIQMQDRNAVNTPIDIWDHIMKINVRGVMLGCKYAIPHMIRNGGGSIINTASDSALGGDNVRITYGTSKAAVIALTKYVASQHGRYNIPATRSCPARSITIAWPNGRPWWSASRVRH